MGSSAKLVKPSDGNQAKCLPARKTAAGPSVVFKDAFGKNHSSVVAACEICGTVHSGEKKVVRFMKRKMVVSCCGRLLDDAYAEAGFLFCVKLLKEFSEDPSNPKFAGLRKELTIAFANAMEKIGTLLKLEEPDETDFTIETEPALQE